MNKKYYYEISSLLGNIISIIIIILLLLILKLFNIDVLVETTDFILFGLLLIPYFILHEILHSVGYVVNGADFDRITYGMHIEKGILCCSCKQEISKKNMLWSLMYPFIFIGVLTLIIGIIFKMNILILLSIANIGGCAADLFMFFDFLKIKDFKFFEYDNPLGFGIITKENLDNKKFFGLKRYEETDFKQTVGKKITISTASYIILIAYMAIFLFDLIFAR